MMYDRDEAGEIIGVLTDFDLAVSLDEPIQSKGPQELHGTAPFMPLDFQFGREHEYTLQHDFESAYYILVWVVLGYKNGKPPPGKEDPLILWRNRSWEQIAIAKELFFNKPTHHVATGDLVRPGYEGLLEPIEKLRIMIFVRNFSRRLQLLKMPQVVDPPHLTPSQFFGCFGVK
jgi:Fungal protein kinase